MSALGAILNLTLIIKVFKSVNEPSYPLPKLQRLHEEGRFGWNTEENQTILKSNIYAAFSLLALIGMLVDFTLTLLGFYGNRFGYK